MDNLTCMKCGKASPEHVLRFFTVNVNVSSYTRGNTRVTTTQERIAGVEKYAVCEECIVKKRKSHTIACSLGGLAAGFLGSLLLMMMLTGSRVSTRNIGAVVGLAAIAGVVIAIITFVNTMKTHQAFLAAMLLRSQKGRAASGMKYVPVYRDAYISPKTGKVDESIFKSKNGLKTKVGNLLFTLISADVGNQLVDEILAKQNNTNTVNPSTSASLSPMGMILEIRAMLSDCLSVRMMMR